jgi:multicomponent Na+:H+ antiporter subunit E
VIGRIATWGWLVIVFLALFESVTPAAVVGGAVVAGALMVLFPPRRSSGGPVTRVRPLALLRAIGRFAVRLVQANAQVAWAVLAPSRAGLRRGIVAVPVAPASDTVLTLLAISISLTPGTSIVDNREDPLVLYVHVLQLASADAVRADVLRMQRGLAEALGPSSTIEDIDRRLRALEQRVAEGGTIR